MTAWKKRVIPLLVSLSLCMGTLSAPVYAEGEKTEASVYEESSELQEETECVQAPENTGDKEEPEESEKPEGKEVDDVPINEESASTAPDTESDADSTNALQKDDREEKTEEELEEPGEGETETEITYKLSFDANGGTASPAALDAEQGSAQIPEQSPNRMFYEFMGWAEAADAETAQYQPGDTILLEADLILYAVWKEGDYPVLGTEYPIHLNAEITSPGMSRIYCLIPERDVILHLESTVSEDAVIGIYSGEKEKIAGDDDGGQGKNFALDHRFCQGQTYYLVVWFYDQSLCSELAFDLTDPAFSADKLPETKTFSLQALSYFVPEKTGTYCLESSGTADTYAYIETWDGTTVGVNDDGGEGLNFSLTCKLQAGVFYLIRLNTFDFSGDPYEVSLSRVLKSAKFTDLAENAFYLDAVEWAVENGITGGKTATTFAPNDECTRAQVVTFLWRYYGSPEPASDENPFLDVEADTPFTKAILWAYQEGITAGTDSTHFKPYNPVTRAQFVTFLWRANGYPEPADSRNPFVDVASGGPFYKAILWAKEQGITQGTDDTHFAPDNYCTRGQVVTFIYRGSQENT